MFLTFSFIIFLLLVWYYWRKFSPYFSFPAYTLFTDWRKLLLILQGKGHKKQRLEVYFKNGLLEYAKKHMKEGIIVVWLPQPLLLIYSPEPIKFFSNEPSVVDKTWIYKLLDSFLKQALLTSSGLKMKKQRKMLSPAFYPSMMKKYATTMTDHAGHLVKEINELENNTAHDLHEIMEKRTLLLFFDAVFGIKTDSANKDKTVTDITRLLVSCLDFVTYRMVRPWLHMDFMLYFSKSGRQHLKFIEQLDNTLLQIIEDMKKSFTSYILEYEASPYCIKNRYRSFGDMLIEQHLRDPSYTLQDIRSDIFVLIFGGYDTISHSLTWTLWLLGVHQDVQERALDEIEAVTDEVIQHENVRKLVYLECIIKESLRLYPVAPTYARKCKKDLHFRKYLIPSGTTVAFVPLFLHRNPEVFEDPESFNPDRFYLNKGTVKPWSFIPFAEGIRSCIGKNYAMLDMKIVLAEIIRNFKIISLTREEDIRLCWDVMLKNKKPLSVKFIPR